MGLTGRISWLHLHFKAIFLLWWRMHWRRLGKAMRWWEENRVGDGYVLLRNEHYSLGLKYQKIYNTANRIQGLEGTWLGCWLSRARLTSLWSCFCTLNFSVIMIYDCMKSFKWRFVWLSVSIKVTIMAIFLFPNKCFAEHNSASVYASRQWLISFAKFFIFHN